MAKIQPGEVRNPNGRPKGSTKGKKLKELLEDHVPAAVDALVLCLSNDDGRVVVQAAKEILTRVYGVPVQALPEQPADQEPPQNPVYAELRRTDPTPIEFPPEDAH